MTYQFTFQEIIIIQTALNMYMRERKDLPGGYAEDARRILEKIEVQRYPAISKAMKKG